MAANSCYPFFKHWAEFLDVAFQRFRYRVESLTGLVSEHSSFFLTS